MREIKREREWEGGGERERGGEKEIERGIENDLLLMRKADIL